MFATLCLFYGVTLAAAMTLKLMLDQSTLEVVYVATQEAHRRKGQGLCTVSRVAQCMVQG